MSEFTYDVSVKRRTKKYSRKELVGRIFWRILSPVFRISPRPMWWIRNLILRTFGAKISKSVRIYPTVRISIPWNLSIAESTTVGEFVNLYALGPIEIGARTTISQNVHICAGTHDFENPEFTLLREGITIGEDVWICADAFVGPKVNVGNGAVVGARGVVVKNVDPWTVVAGNPAKLIRSRKGSVSSGDSISGN